MDTQEIRDLYEAYLQVHQPQELTEEVEAWVSNLLEEGYDLSEYTWDDMYEIYMEEVENLEEARRADREGYARGTAANPTRAQTDVPHSDPSQRTSLHSKFRRRSDEMGRARRNSPRNRSGGRTPVSPKEKAFLQAGDRTSPGRGHVRSPNVGDTGRHSDEGRYDRQDKKNPKLNPKHSANRENAAESFDLFDTILEHLVAEGYADTNEAALAIMANMSEEWRESIVEEVLDERNRGEQGMSDREVTRRRNLGGNVRSRVSASSLGDHGSQSAIQKFHKGKAKQRREIHKSGRGTRGDTGESGGQSRYQANKDHSDGYPSITKRGDGPY